MKRTQVLRTLGGLAAVSAGAIPLRIMAAAPRKIILRIVAGKNGIVGPDHLKHVAFVPANFTVAAGVPGTVTVINESVEHHSITCSAIPLDQAIAPAKRNKDGTITPVTTKFTFTARPGTWRWYCKEPCDMDQHMWSMTPGETGRGQEGYMAGHITAV